LLLNKTKLFVIEYLKEDDLFMNFTNTYNQKTLTYSLRQSLKKINYDRGIESFNNFQNSIEYQENLNSTTRIFVGKMEADPG
jgi:hypothetical protein